MSNRKDLERRLEQLADGGSGNGGGGSTFFPHSEYTPEDFQTGNFDPADPFTPLTREQAADDVEFFGLDETPEELRRQSIEWAIDRLENPEDYPAPGDVELTDADREFLDQTFGVTPTTAVDPETWGGNNGE